MAGGFAVHRGPFCIGVAGTDVALPPLAKVRYRGVMQGHLGAQAMDCPAGLAKTDAHLRLFAGYDVGVVTADLLEGGDADHRVAAAGVRLAHWRVPFDVAEAVIDRGVGMLLTAAAADDRPVEILFELLCGKLDPTGDDFAVTIDELNIGAIGNARETGVPRAGGGEGLAMSSSTTSTPMDSAIATLPSIEPEST